MPRQSTCKVQVPGVWRQALSTPECQRQGRARTLAPHPPRTVKQQACLLDQSELQVGGFRCEGKAPAGAGAWCLAASTLRTGVPAARTSTVTHIDSASASHREAASILARSVGVSFGGFLCEGKAPVRCRCLASPGGKHSPHRSASGRDEQVPWLHIRLAL